MRRALIWPVVAAVVGLLAVGAGVWLLTKDRVECEIGQQMRPGEVCVNAQRPGRSPIALTYEEQRASDRRFGVLMLGVGALTLGYGGWIFWKDARRPRPQ